MDVLDHKTDELFRSIESKSEVLFQNLEAKGNHVFERFERKMSRALNTFWVILGATIVFGVTFMIDTSVTVSGKANASELVNYAKSTDVVDAFKFEHMRTNDCYILRDSTVAKTYDYRYIWQIETILNRSK